METSHEPGPGEDSSMEVFREEPEYKEELRLFDKSFLYLGKDSFNIYVEDPDTGEEKEMGYWEFIEGRLEATGEVG